MEKVINAFKFALERHSGQLRKDGSTPYIVHPFRIFLWLADEGKIYDENVLAAAFLHDLIEDTKTDYDDIMKGFRDKEIANIVAVLTKDKTLPEKVREKMFNQKLKNASWKSKVIKLADIYDNLCDMDSWSAPKSEKISKLAEKQEQLKFLKENLPERYERIFKIVEKQLRKTRARSIKHRR